jgi:hypothetical protein
MKRQVVPSMILSVLFVCFFAVMLFERDPPQGVEPRIRTGISTSPNSKEGPAPPSRAPSDSGAKKEPAHTKVEDQHAGTQPVTTETQPNGASGGTKR